MEPGLGLLLCWDCSIPVTKSAEPAKNPQLADPRLAGNRGQHSKTRIPIHNTPNGGTSPSSTNGLVKHPSKFFFQNGSRPAPKKSMTKEKPILKRPFLGETKPIYHDKTNKGSP